MDAASLAATGHGERKMALNEIESSILEILKEQLESTSTITKLKLEGDRMTVEIRTVMPMITGTPLRIPYGNKEVALKLGLICLSMRPSSVLAASKALRPPIRSRFISRVNSSQNSRNSAGSMRLLLRAPTAPRVRLA
jgi:hypothetical protein